MSFFDISNIYGIQKISFQDISSITEYLFKFAYVAFG